MASKSGVSCPKFDVGGQAVMEGVMMCSPERTAVVVRQENGKIVARVKPNKQLSKKYKILGWPIIRGVVNFIMMMVLGVQTLTESAEMAGMEVEEPSAFEKKMAKTLGKSVEDVMMVLAVVLALALSIGLFFVVPTLIESGLRHLMTGGAEGVLLSTWQKLLLNLVGGVIRIAMFIGYILLVRNVPGALLLGILATAAAGIPLGLTHFERLLNVPPGIEPIFMKMQWENIMSIDMAVCVATLLFMDIFDTMGTLIGVGQRVGLVNEKGDMPGMNKAFMADSIGTTAGAMLGTTTVSTFIESAAGVNAGGRSGLTAMVTAICFLLALFFAPLFVAIPKAATAPAMFIVGMMMMGDVVKLDFRNYSVAVPCFVCIVFMPFTYSISDGILLGVITWVAVSIFSGRTKELKRTTVMLAMLFVLKYVFL